jgi:hypothetical protein
MTTKAQGHSVRYLQRLLWVQSFWSYMVSFQPFSRSAHLTLMLIPLEYLNSPLSQIVLLVFPPDLRCRNQFVHEVAIDGHRSD